MSSVEAQAFDPACEALDHVAYSGDLASIASHSWDMAVCDLGPGPNASFDPGSGNRFFVVVGHDDVAEGSYGQRSSGGERPEATGLASCDRPQDLSNSCD